MSIRVMTWIWSNSEAKGVELLIELALADYADDQGRSFPSTDSIAHKARCSQRYVIETIANMEADGRLTVEKNAGPNATNVYTLTMNKGGELSSGVNSGGAIFQGEIQRRQSSPDPSGSVIDLDPSGSVTKNFYSGIAKSAAKNPPERMKTNASEPRTPDRREPATPTNPASLADRLRPDDERGAREHIPRRYREL